MNYLEDSIEYRNQKEEQKCFWIMFSIMSVILLMVILSTDAKAYTLDQWADAIKITEDVNSKYPYGIKSIHVVNALQARKICKNTVGHAWNDFEGSKADLRAFVGFLADRYCPISADPIGNRNWKHNMIALMEANKHG